MNPKQQFDKAKANFQFALVKTSLKNFANDEHDPSNGQFAPSGGGGSGNKSKADVERRRANSDKRKNHNPAAAGERAAAVDNDTAKETKRVSGMFSAQVESAAYEKADLYDDDTSPKKKEGAINAAIRLVEKDIKLEIENSLPHLSKAEVKSVYEDMKTEAITKLRKEAGLD